MAQSILIIEDEPQIVAVLRGYFEQAFRLSRIGTVIVVDNVVRNGGVIDPNGDANVQGVRRFNEMLVGETRVTSTTLQTVGSKGYDGFTLSLVTSL